MVEKTSKGVPSLRLGALMGLFLLCWWNAVNKGVRHTSTPFTQTPTQLNIGLTDPPQMLG
jgi:hypothetical protein